MLVHCDALEMRVVNDPIYGSRSFVAGSIVDKRKHNHEEFDPCPSGGEDTDCPAKFDFKIYWPKWPGDLGFTWEPWIGPNNDSNCPSNMVYEYLWRIESRQAINRIAQKCKGGLKIHGIRPHHHSGELQFSITDAPCFNNSCCNALFDFLIGPGPLLPHLSSLDKDNFICVRDRDLPAQLRTAALGNKFYDLTIPDERGEFKPKKTAD